MRAWPSGTAPRALAVALLAGFGVAGAAPVAFAEPGADAACDPVVVAVLDTGINAKHPEFAGVNITFQDFVGAWPTPYDDHGHGTATASLVSGATVGARPGTTLLVGKVLDRYGSGSFEAIAAGIAWAVEHDADVISMSLGTLGPYPGILTAVSPQIDAAHASGALVITSAGNSYVVPSETASPSNHPHILSVGATNENGTPSTYSNLNPELSAWGTNVRVAAHTGGYKPWTGTSFAAPQVAGWAADGMHAACETGVPRAEQPDLVEHALKATANDTWRPYAEEGHGIVDADTAAAATACVRAGGACATSIYNDVPNLASDAVRFAWG